jgi:hypothetical protein
MKEQSCQVVQNQQTLLGTKLESAMGNRSLTIAVQMQDFRAARVSKRHLGTAHQPGNMRKQHIKNEGTKLPSCSQSTNLAGNKAEKRDGQSLPHHCGLDAGLPSRARKQAALGTAR